MSMSIAMEMEMAMETETKMITLTVVVVYEQDIVVIPQIQVGLHTAGHMSRHILTCTLVVYDNILTLVTKGLPKYPQYESTFGME